jgi:hypothetical protein
MRRVADETAPDAATPSGTGIYKLLEYDFSRFDHPRLRLETSFVANLPESGIWFHCTINITV